MRPAATRSPWRSAWHVPRHGGGLGPVQIAARADGSDGDDLVATPGDVGHQSTRTALDGPGRGPGVAVGRIPRSHPGRAAPDGNEQSRAIDHRQDPARGSRGKSSRAQADAMVEVQTRGRIAGRARRDHAAVADVERRDADRERRRT